MHNLFLKSVQWMEGKRLVTRSYTVGCHNLDPRAFLRRHDSLDYERSSEESTRVPERSDT